jgi:bile acid:Na+ symporter, BASS family
VLVPVALGMIVAAIAPQLAARFEKAFKIFSAIVLAAFAIIAIVKEWGALQQAFSSLAPVVILFNLASLLMGYYLSRAGGMDKPMSTAISYEIGIHNSTLAIFVAVSVLKDFQYALPAAMYSISMYITATLFGLLVLRPKAAAQS